MGGGGCERGGERQRQIYWHALTNVGTHPGAITCCSRCSPPPAHRPFFPLTAPVHSLFVLVPLVRLQTLAGLEVPEAEAVVKGAGEDVLAVGGEFDEGHWGVALVDQCL